MCYILFRLRTIRVGLLPSNGQTEFPAQDLIFGKKGESPQYEYHLFFKKKQ
jgi:hypothetical protein